jgi:diguanylate cyclase
MTERGGRPIGLLLADDDAVDRQKLRRLLSATGLSLNILDASTGNQALELVRNPEVDCAIVDYRLGDTTGTELTRALKAERKVPFPVIMVTGLGDETVAVRAMREGAYDYLSKARLQVNQLKASIEGSLSWAEHEAQLVEAQERLTRLSMFDGLTGLPNRNLFFDRLEQALLGAGRGGPPFAVIMMDLNRFKAVNDDLGHDAGDRLLVEFSRRLSQLARKSDTYARLGGDEFAGLLVGTHSNAGAASVAERIGRAMREPAAIEAELVTFGVSIGIAMFPADGHDARGLLAAADEAMYRAKRGSRGYESFAPGRPEQDGREVLIGSHLPEAMERRELVLHYQPKVDLRTGELVGVEALVRWQSPRLGLVGPADFIPAAERSQLIIPMTYRILDMALDQCRSWLDGGRRIPVAVNLSARVLDDEHLTKRVAAALESRNLEPRMLTLELTETALMTSGSRSQSVLRELRDIGVGISIDDFGAGYTSFRNLRDYAISEIKIDPLFVGSLKDQGRDASIVRSIAALSEGFDVAIVAEGVESSECCALLRSLGCNFGQGYGIGRPMAAESVRGWSWDYSVPPPASEGIPDRLVLESGIQVPGGQKVRPGRTA